jgi:tRNA (mo5U34)-methyltransferase
MSSAKVVTEDEKRLLRNGIAAIGPWFHNFEIAKGVWTNPDGAGPGEDYPARRWTHVAPWFSEVGGKNCLDVGSSSGFFSLKAAELGALSVLGTDSGEQIHATDQAVFANKVLGLRADFQRVSAYDLPQLGRQFDVVVFMGVLYHLRHPLLALEALRRVCRETLILQTITAPSSRRLRELDGVARDVQLNSRPMLDVHFPTLRFVEGGLAGDTTCWFVPNVEGVAAMLRSCGFVPRDFIFPNVQEIFVRCTVA